MDATDYYFDVTIDGKPEHVRVTVQAEATTVLERWLADPANLHRIGRAGEVEELTVDFCAARILEALDKRIDLTKEDSFLVIQGAPPALEKLPTPIVTENIREYISRRPYAAWGECGEDISCCQLFTRIDWLYLKVTQRDLRRVIDLHIDELWTEEVQDQMYLKATRSLIKDLERPRKREPAVLTPFYLPSSAAPVSTGKPPASVAHPRRERVLGATLNRFIEQEAERRGPIWQVAAVLLGLALAALALL